jgi:hypothetical protein
MRKFSKENFRRFELTPILNSFSRMMKMSSWFSRKYQSRLTLNHRQLLYTNLFLKSNNQRSYPFHGFWSSHCWIQTLSLETISRTLHSRQQILDCSRRGVELPTFRSAQVESSKRLGVQIISSLFPQYLHSIKIFLQALYAVWNFSSLSRCNLGFKKLLQLFIRACVELKLYVWISRNKQLSVELFLDARTSPWHQNVSCKVRQERPGGN